MKHNTTSTTLWRLALGTCALAILLALWPTRAHAETKAWDPYAVSIKTDLVAEPSLTARELGRLRVGDTVRVIDSSSNAGFWYVYSDTHRRNGWVNRFCLRRETKPTPQDTTEDLRDHYRVRVESGFLALRTHPEYDDGNILERLYTGDVVVAIHKYDGNYWWVYSSKHSQSGYADNRCLEPL